MVDFCCASLVSHYLNDIPCKIYNYTFVFVKVIPKTLLVPFFSGHGVVYKGLTHAIVLDQRPYNTDEACDIEI